MKHSEKSIDEQNDRMDKVRLFLEQHGINTDPFQTSFGTYLRHRNVPLIEITPGLQATLMRGSYLHDGEEAKTNRQARLDAMNKDIAQLKIMAEIQKYLNILYDHKDEILGEEP